LNPRGYIPSVQIERSSEPEDQDTEHPETIVGAVEGTANRQMGMSPWAGRTGRKLGLARRLPSGKQPAADDQLVCIVIVEHASEGEADSRGDRIVAK